MVNCKECGEDKKSRYKDLCNSCYLKEWYKKHPHYDKEQSRKRRQENPEKDRAYTRKWRKENPEKDKAERKRWKEKNPDYYKNRMKNDINFKLRNDLADRILIAIKKQLGNKAYGTIKLLGCSVQECREYIEKQWEEGMNWSNHSRDGWHIHHRIPCHKFDLTKEEEQLKCFHYTNLQPMWAKDHNGLDVHNKISKFK